MSAVDWIGSIGVGILLLAFLLNLARRLRATSAVYQVMNVVGAALACAAAAMIPFYPFVLLEGTWCLVALVALLRTTLGEA